MTPIERAREWLLANGYKQFSDGVWSFEGCEADVENVLAEFIEQLVRRIGQNS